MDALGPAAAVLVGLDLHERRLRRAAQPRQRPRVRVGLLELVRGAVDHELGHLAPGRLALDVAWTAREPSSASAIARSARSISSAASRLGGRPDLARERLLELALEPGAELEQPGIPLPALVHARKPAVVELVAAVEGELEVLVGSGSATPGAGRHRPAPAAAGRAAHRADSSLRGPRGVGQNAHHVAGYPLARGSNQRPSAKRSASHGPSAAQVAALGHELALAQRAVALDERARTGQLRRGAEPGGHRLELADEGVEHLPSGPALAAPQVGERALHPVAARRPAVLLDPPCGRGSAELAGVVALRQPDHERVGHRRDRGRLGDRGLRVGHPQLQRSVGGWGELPPPQRRLRKRSRGRAPAQLRRQLVPAREGGGNPLARAGLPRSSGGSTRGRCRRPRGTARWRPAPRARAGARAARCTRRACGPLRPRPHAPGGRRPAGAAPGARTRPRSARSAHRRSAAPPRG